ncbi:MFS general substrate transporter [Daedaleopsis nitida]|nr:MFS general substrate transporter [Daedaleopsis nitida]
MDASETSPLLASESVRVPEASESRPGISGNEDASATAKHDLLYSRFSRRQQRGILALLAWTGVIPFLVSGTFVPCIPQIARELNTTGSVINMAVSISLASVAFGSLIWATYSGQYGRRVVYFASLPCLCVGSVGVACSQTVPQLLWWRFFQAFGSSSALSVGGAVIGDIYRLEERGMAMGIFFSASLFGAAIAPMCGGIAAHYASWRHAHWVLFFMGLLALLLVAKWLPETIDPDVLKERRESRKRFAFLRVNPFASLALLRSPNLMLVTLAGSLAVATDFVLLNPLSYTIAQRYNITNEALIGACFMPVGAGNLIGAPISGMLSDRAVVAWRKRRGGVWVPEDRLRATPWGAGLLVPMSMLLSGLTIKYVPGTPGFVLSLAWLFLNGIGVDIVLTPSSAYYVDILHTQSAEIMAASGAFRALFVASVTAGVLPMINTIGVAATDAISAGIAWLGLGMFLVTIRYGDRMRAWVDVGFSTAQTN